METGVKRTQRDDTMALKLAVVGQVGKGELTSKQAQAKYGIQGRPTVLTWLRKHGRRGWGRAASSAARPIDKDPTSLTPEQQIKALQVELARTWQRAKFIEHRVASERHTTALQWVAQQMVICRPPTSSST